MTRFIYFAIFALVFSLQSLPNEIGVDSFRSEVLIHTGTTGLRTQKLNGTRRDDAGQIGYDLKFGLDIDNFRPFILAHGHWVLDEIHTQIGLGSYYFVNSSEFQLDFLRKREKALDINGKNFHGDIILYKIRLLWSYPLYKFKGSTFKSIIGIGSNSHGDRKIFKLNKGEYYSAGLRLHFDQDKDTDESFLAEIFWEQDTIRSLELKQSRNSAIVRLGKRF